MPRPYPAEFRARAIELSKWMRQDAEHVTVEKDSPRAMRIRMPINRPGQPLC